MEEAKSLSAQFPSQSILAVSTLYSHIYLHSGFIAGGVVTQCYAKAEPVRMRQHVEKVYCCKLHSFIGCNEKWSRLITPVEAYPTTHTYLLMSKCIQICCRFEPKPVFPWATPFSAVRTHTMRPCGGAAVNPMTLLNC